MNRSYGLALVGLLLASPAVAFGQDRPLVEIGTSGAISIVSQHGADNTVSIGLPYQGLGSPTIYFSFFPSERIVVEPEVSLRYLANGGNNANTVAMIGHLDYLFRGATEGSGYVSAQAGFLRLSASSNSATAYAVGGGVGYRAPVAGVLAVSVEGRYRRWTGKTAVGEAMNELAVVVSLGALVKR